MRRRTHCRDMVFRDPVQAFLHVSKLPDYDATSIGYALLTVNRDRSSIFLV